ncbi:MAG: hypothetical protein ACXVRQ_01855 [Gaiellaceae bacterium]
MLRIVSAGALLAVMAAGCGSGDRPRVSAVHGVPRALAQAWEGQASAIASAASAGNSCRALHLAASLRDDVVSSQQRVPSRLRSALLTGVNALADRITCTPVPTQPHKPPKGPTPKQPKPPDHHGPGGDKGDHH